MGRGESPFVHPLVKWVSPLLLALSPLGLGGGAGGEHVCVCTRNLSAHYFSSLQFQGHAAAAWRLTSEGEPARGLLLARANSRTAGLRGVGMGREACLRGWAGGTKEDWALAGSSAHAQLTQTAFEAGPC